MCKKLEEAARLTKKVDEEYTEFEKDRDTTHLKRVVRLLNKRAKLVKERKDYFATLI